MDLPTVPGPAHNDGNIFFGDYVKVYNKSRSGAT